MLRKIKKDGLAKTHKNSLEVVNSYCGDLDLIDVWRIKNPEQGRFTFSLESQCTSCSSINTDFVPGYKKEKKRKDGNLRA